MDLNNEFQRTTSYLKNVPVETEPFEHFLVRDPFSQEMYEALLDNLPDDDAYEWGRGSVTAEKKRGYLYFNRHHLGRLAPEQQRFWEHVRRWTLSGDFYSTIMGKYRSAINKRLGDQPRGSFLLGDVKLIRDKTNYSLQPHTDHPSRVTTIMFYLPRDHSLQDCGTAIYTPKTPDMKCAGIGRHPFSDFDLVAKAPFVPNSGLCFLKSDTSFHGVEPIHRPDICRDFLTFSIRCVRESLKHKMRRHVSAIRGKQPNYRLNAMAA